MLMNSLLKSTDFSSPKYLVHFSNKNCPYYLKSFIKTVRYFSKKIHVQKKGEKKEASTGAVDVCLAKPLRSLVAQHRWA